MDPELQPDRLFCIVGDVVRLLEQSATQGMAQTALEQSI